MRDVLQASDVIQFRIDNSRFKRLGDRGAAMIIWVEVIGGKSAAP